MNSLQEQERLDALSKQHTAALLHAQKAYKKHPLLYALIPGLGNRIFNPAKRIQVELLRLQGDLFESFIQTLEDNTDAVGIACMLSYFCWVSPWNFDLPSAFFGVPGLNSWYRGRSDTEIFQHIRAQIEGIGISRRHDSGALPLMRHSLQQILEKDPARPSEADSIDWESLVERSRGTPFHQAIRAFLSNRCGRQGGLS